MITNLHIKNIGIIEELNMNLKEGFNVITGETGAGKTLLIEAMGILAGARFSKEMIRTGAEYSYVEMCLFVPQHSLAEDGNIILSREVHISGKNLCRINGRMITVNELKNVMKNIVAIHGQNDNQPLLDSSSHIQYLDDFGNQKLERDKTEYQNLYEQYKKLQEKRKQNYGDDKEKQRKLDLLYYQVKEIEEAHLKIGEEEKLEVRRNKITNAQKIAQNIQEAYEQIGENAIDSINIAIRALEKIENLSEDYAQKSSNLKSVYYELQELARDLGNETKENDFSEEEIEEIETRLDLLFSLKRKYGNSIEEILHYKQEIEKEIDTIENAEEYRKQLKDELNMLQNKMIKVCQKIHQLRQEYAAILSENINKELQELEMGNSRFKVLVQKKEEGKFDENGLDKVEFLISTNVGEEEKSLIKIASGGEMSRIMLAIKTVLADTDEVPVLVFDEIDTGISGKTAVSVSQKMKKIAQKHQVICITHLANIAAKGDYNYYIHKQIKENKTNSCVKLLNEEETIKEIARISGGDTSAIALEHARELRAS